MTRVLMLFLSVLFGTGPSQGAGWEWESVECEPPGRLVYSVERSVDFLGFVMLHQQFQEHFGLADGIDDALDYNAAFGSSVFEVGGGIHAAIGATYVHDGAIFSANMIEHHGDQRAEFLRLTTERC